jgi:hypothetical protein
LIIIFFPNIAISIGLSSFFLSIGRMPGHGTRGATISASRFSSQRCLPNGLLDGGWIGWIWVRLISGKKTRCTLPQIVENDSWHTDIGCQISKTQPFFGVWELKQVSWELLKMIYQPEIWWNATNDKVCMSPGQISTASHVWNKKTMFPFFSRLEKLPRQKAGFNHETHWIIPSYLSNHSEPSSPWGKSISSWLPLNRISPGWMISNSSWNWSYLTGLVTPSIG